MSYFENGIFLLLIILTGQATLLSVVILSIPQLELVNVADILEWIFLMIFPNFGLAQGLNNIYQNSKIGAVCQNLSLLCYLGPNPCCRGKVSRLLITF